MRNYAVAFKFDLLIKVAYNEIMGSGKGRTRRAQSTIVQGSAGTIGVYRFPEGAVDGAIKVLSSIEALGGATKNLRSLLTDMKPEYDERNDQEVRLVFEGMTALEGSVNDLESKLSGGEGGSAEVISSIGGVRITISDIKDRLEDLEDIGEIDRLIHGGGKTDRKSVV